MKREDFLKAFAEMTPEDQDAIRAELIGKGASQETGEPLAMCHAMMENIMASKDPMAMCKEMMEKMKAGGSPMAMWQEMIQKMKGKCC